MQAKDDKKNRVAIVTDSSIMSLESDDNFEANRKAMDVNTASTSTSKKNYTNLRSIILEKRAVLRKSVKRNTKCHHLQIYTEANAVCKRITVLYEEDKISMRQAMELMFETHEQLSHKGLPKDVVAQNMHKHLDKLQESDKTTFGIVMANTNSSVHVRKPARVQEEEENSLEAEKYSESYWADIIS